MDFVVFGTGNRAEKFLIQWYGKIEISFFFDNYKKEKFHGYTVYSPFYKENIFIVVAVENVNVYQSIREQLIKLGYKEFEDFVPYTIFKKKVAVAYGNCHIDAIRKYMELSTDFDREYGFYPFPLIQNLSSYLLIPEIIKRCDFLIHQSIRRENPYGEEYASEEMLKNIRKECYVLSVPNLHGLPECFFPQLQRRNAPKILINDLLAYTEINIKKWVGLNMCIKEMEEYISCGGVYSYAYIRRLWEEFISKLEKREEEWDIKISDYIYTHYQKEKLFTDRWHISTFLAREIANRVLEKLGCETIQDIIIPCLDTYEVFIYADVKKALNLKFSEKSIRNFSREKSRIEFSEMTLEKYIEMCKQIYIFEKNIDNT